MTNGFSKSKKADVSDKYNHVRGELKRARARIQELEAALGLAPGVPVASPVRDHVRRLLARANGEPLPPVEVFIKPAKE